MSAAPFTNTSATFSMPAPVANSETSVLAAEPPTATDNPVDGHPSPAKHPRRRRVAVAKAAPPAAAKPRPDAAEASVAPAKAPADDESDGDAGPYRIQFGAFTIEDNAHKLQWAVEATGLPVEVARLPNTKGHLLYYVRSQPFPDRAAALSAATAARDKAKGFVNAEPIEYVLVGDMPSVAQR